MRILRRAAVLILLALLLGTPWAGASQSPRIASPPSFLASLGGLLTSFWLEGGCTLDPLGLCAPSTQTLQVDGGCTIDPNGRCAPSTQTLQVDGGCTIDPNGRCAPDH